MQITLKNVSFTLHLHVCELGQLLKINSNIFFFIRPIAVFSCCCFIPTLQTPKQAIDEFLTRSSSCMSKIQKLQPTLWKCGWKSYVLWRPKKNICWLSSVERTLAALALTTQAQNSQWGTTENFHLEVRGSVPVPELILCLPASAGGVINGLKKNHSNHV